MLSQLKKLGIDTDGRYATDEELQFLDDYIKSFASRLQTYQALQLLEATIVRQVETKMRSLDPTLLESGNEDISAKWRCDTVRVLRYAAAAMLINDPETLCERFLFWFQTIMQAFGAQESCNVTYEIMQEVVGQDLTAIQASLFCPMLELNRRILSKKTVYR